MTIIEALHVLQVAGLIHAAVLPGMLFGTPKEVWRAETKSAVPAWIRHQDCRLDLTDPATVGCLLALLREATGDPCVTVSVLQATDGSAVEWSVDSGLKLLRRVTGQAPPWWAGVELFTLHATEGEAIAAALIALYAEVSRG